MPEGSENVALMERFLNAFNRHDLEGAMSLMTDDVVFVSSSMLRAEGQAEVRKAVTGILENTPDVNFAVDGPIFATSEWGCAEWVMTGTHKERGKLNVRGCDIFGFRGGKVSQFGGFNKRS